MAPIRLSFSCGLIALALLSGGPTAAVVAQTSADEKLEAFPPMPNDRPPGASRAAWAVAAALGRGVNYGNMLEAPREGDWGLSVREEFIDATAGAGFASVRLPVRWSNHAAATA